MNDLNVWKNEEFTLLKNGPNEIYAFIILAWILNVNSKHNDDGRK